MGLSMRVLAVDSVPVSESLVVRGLSCLIFVIAFARWKKLSLVPKNTTSQMFRALLAGLALTFLSLSYNWLTASTVSVLSNIDVPLLVVLGPLVGIASSFRVRVLSIVSISFLVWYVSGLEMQENLPLGLTSLLTGSLLLCFGYFYIKKSMAEENEAIAVLTPSVAILIYGIGEYLALGQTSSSWSRWNFILCVASGVGMFGAYLSTMRLYELTDLASAEFPTLISSILIQPVERLFLGEPLKGVYLASATGFVVTTYLILKWNREPAPNPRMDLPRTPQTLDYTCGAACFESMYRYFKGHSPGEMHFARELGTLDAGFTPTDKIVELAKHYGFDCEKRESAEVSDIENSLARKDVVFVTWWDEDAGHYSLVKSIENKQIVLMDPWEAREDLDNELSLAQFVPHWRARGSVIIRVAAR